MGSGSSCAGQLSAPALRAYRWRVHAAVRGEQDRGRRGLVVFQIVDGAHLFGDDRFHAMDAWPAYVGTIHAQIRPRTSSEIRP